MDPYVGYLMGRAVGWYVLDIWPVLILLGLLVLVPALYAGRRRRAL